MCNCCSRIGRRCCCLNFVLAVIAGLVLALVGVILGAAFSTQILGALAAVIVLGVALLVMFILALIYRICTCNNSACDE